MLAALYETTAGDICAGQAVKLPNCCKLCSHWHGTVSALCNAREVHLLSVAGGCWLAVAGWLLKAALLSNAGWTMAESGKPGAQTCKRVTGTHRNSATYLCVARARWLLLSYRISGGRPAGWQWGSATNFGRSACPRATPGKWGHWVNTSMC